MTLIFSAENYQYAYKLEQLFQRVSMHSLFALLFLCEPWELGGSALGCLIFPVLEHQDAPTLKSPGYPPVFTVQKCQICILYTVRKRRVKRKEEDFKTEEGGKSAFRLNAFKKYIKGFQGTAVISVEQHRSYPSSTTKCCPLSSTRCPDEFQSRQ